MFREKIDSHERLQSRNRFLFKTLFPIIVLTLFLTFYTFSTEILIITAPTPSTTTTTTNNNTISDSINITFPSDSNEEKFLTYLPHSGFHNQHGALMNSIMMAYLTNRTLILPPVLVYYYPSFNDFYTLYDKLNKTIKIKTYRMNHCSESDLLTDDDNGRINDDNVDNIFNSQILCNKRYSKYDKFTMVDWEQIFDFSEIRKYVKMIHRGYDFSLDTLNQKFNFSKDDTFLIVEKEQYELRFYDNDDSNISLEQFKKKILISDLLKIDQKLLHFSSLFSHHRIKLEKEKNINFVNLIHNKLTINNPNVLRVTDHVIKELGGKGNYFGLHIRVGDAKFRIHEGDSINIIYDELINSLVKLDLIRDSKKFFNFNLKKCLKYNLPIIYIATDSGDPKREFVKFYNNIPCIFTLFDFTKDLENFGKISSDFDKDIDLINFYIPLMDLLITAHGGIFIGTNGSTFSRMAYEVHNLDNGKNALGHWP
ncbi:hypothetical protein C1645_757003 [Glomus cerebriforme]|uniref:GDP-fucose protein O-fucosyltransferase n=1 Tax=Glomus cerebriforme TaxID=658196 RepID=A0A397TEC0_9GLOM|nr:hypothetical protein C1645_757003 [Glomus cerebriforme]